MKAVLIITGLVLCCPPLPAQGSKADYDRAANLANTVKGKVIFPTVRPNWIEGQRKFWYRRSVPGSKSEIILVDAVTGEKTPGFDPATLKGGSPKTGGFFHKIKPSRGEGKEIHISFANKTENPIKLSWIDMGGKRKKYGTIAPGKTRKQHTFKKHVWSFRDSKNQKAAFFEASLDGEIVSIEDSVLKAPARPNRSPDGNHEVIIKSQNVFLRNLATGKDLKLTSDGNDNVEYKGKIFWAPDSSKFVALRVKQVTKRKVHLVESSPKGGLQPAFHSFDYVKPGDPLPVVSPVLFDILKPTPTKIEIDNALFKNQWSLSDFRWLRNSKEFTFLFNQRGHQVLRVLSIDATSGKVRIIVEETSPTFIDYAGKRFSRYLPETNEWIWMSERDGWNHLYLYDVATGKVENQITSGEWVVRGVDHVDGNKRQIRFRAGGIHPNQDPYHVHWCRVDFDGSNLVVLTDGDGTHEVEYSPDQKYIIDTWSRVDKPPVTELRSAVDGTKRCDLEEADWSKLLATGWPMPERFVAKGRDQETDIYGVIFRPSNFDPEKTYPVIEKIYAGPHAAFVPKHFKAYHTAQGIAELGFIVVRIDGMGTSYRSKAFHDVAWKNLRDSGFPDRIPWIKAAAKKYPYIDTTRVGIYGGSAGGQSTVAALLWHGDFYKAGVSDCGCHDNRMDKMWWNELWMGWPVDKCYEENSNVVNAHRLTGKLLLTVGELDRNVDPASTMQVVDALIKADKNFEMIVVPGKGHGVGEIPYMKRRRADFFVRHLHGVELRQ